MIGIGIGLRKRRGDGIFSNLLATRTDGVDEHTNVGNDSSLFIGTGDFSISAWVKLSAMPGGLSGIFSPDFIGSGTKGILFGFSGLKIQTFFAVGTGGTFGLNLLSNTNLTIGTRHHVCLTLDRDGNGVMYLDGVNDGQGAMLGNGIDVNDALTYFLGQGDGGTHYAGDTDEVSLWRKNLSLTEVSEIYNSGVPNDLSQHSAETDLISWWRMGDGDAFPTIADNKGTNDGTMINMDASNFVAASS